MSLTLHTQKMAEADYILKEHRDEADPPTFRLRPLNRIQRYAIAGDLRVNENGAHIMSAHGVATTLKQGLVSWSGVTGEDGKELLCTPENQAMLPEIIIDELVKEIWNRSELSEDEGKNSSSQSKSSETRNALTAGNAQTDTTATAPATGPDPEAQPAS